MAKITRTTCGRCKKDVSIVDIVHVYSVYDEDRAKAIVLLEAQRLLRVDDQAVLHREWCVGCMREVESTK